MWHKIFLTINRFLQIKYFLVANFMVLIFKILYSFRIGFDGGTFEDWDIAINIAKYGEYAEFINLGPTAYKLPVYPLFLNFFCYFFPDHAKELTIIAQHLIYFFIPLGIIAIFNIFKKKKNGILAGYLFISSPIYFYYSNVCEVTNIFIPIFLLWIFQYLRIFKNEIISTKSYILFAVTTAILFLTQIVVVPIVIILIIALLFLKRISKRALLLISVISIACYSPWVIRNAIVFDRFIPTKTPVWQNIYISYTKAFNIFDNLKLVPEDREKYIFNIRRYKNEFKMEKIYRDEIVPRINKDRTVIIKKGLQNAMFMWYVPARYFYDNSISILLGRRVYMIILNILTIMALIKVYKINRLLFYAFILLFINFTVPYMIGHAGNTRFRLDFEWIQLMLVSIFLGDLINREIGRLD